MKTATIVGAGLVGSLWAVYLSKAGYKVKIYERRSDIRKAEISAGKSINLALSDRGWKAMDTVGIGDEIRKIFNIKGYDNTDRKKLSLKYSKLFKKITDQNINVLFAGMALFDDTRIWNRINIKNYLEIFIKTNLGFFS